MIGLACLTTALVLWVEHWFPWELVTGRQLPRPAAYVLGVLGLLVPLSGLYLYWWLEPSSLPLAHLIALWAVAVSGGGAVLGAYALDGVLRMRAKVREQDELIELIQAGGADE